MASKGPAAVLLREGPRPLAPVGPTPRPHKYQPQLSPAAAEGKGPTAQPSPLGHSQGWQPRPRKGHRLRVIQPRVGEKDAAKGQSALGAGTRVPLAVSFQPLAWFPGRGSMGPAPKEPFPRGSPALLRPLAQATAWGYRVLSAQLSGAE